MTPLPDHEDRRAALLDFQRNLVVTAGAGNSKFEFGLTFDFDKVHALTQNALRGGS